MKTDTIRVTEEMAVVMRDMTPAERSHVFEVGLCVIREGDKWEVGHLGCVITYLVDHQNNATVQNIVDLTRRLAEQAHQEKAKRATA